jgi:hypothetical protein
MNTFVGTLQTLITKTMEDTIMTIKAYEKARLVLFKLTLNSFDEHRIEYDAYRHDYEIILSRNHTGGVSLSITEEHIERQYHHFKERYEKLKMNVIVKIKLLDENRVCVFSLKELFFYCKFEICLDKSDETTIGAIS